MSGTSMFDNLAAKARENDVRRQAQAEAERIKNAQRQQEREAARERARVTQQHGYFITGFVAAMEKLMIDGGWHVSAVELSLPYCEALVKFDGELPELSSSLKVHIHQKFAYGVFLAGDKLPEDLMVGQRQEWCQEELTKLRASKSKGPSFKAKPAPADFPSTETVPFASSESEGFSGGNVIQLPEAITKPTRKGATKKAAGTTQQASKRARSQSQQIG